MYKDNKHKNRSVLGLVPYRHSNPPEITFRFYSANWMSNLIKKTPLRFLLTVVYKKQFYIMNQPYIL